ncbi:HdeD family acid-resistance protein [Aurantiacibacter rhizosphaerae]|nr:DUF308 domain-containing protein [Aurantiacibacter rhizosphaerae]
MTQTRPFSPSRWLLAYGILCLAVGVLALIWPAPASLAAVTFAAFLLLISGVGALGIAIGRHTSHPFYDAMLGMLSIAVGIWMLVQPVEGAVSLTILLAIWFAGRGLLELYSAVKWPFRRVWMVVMGVLNLALAVLCVTLLPGSALIVPGTLLAVSFFVSGMGALLFYSSAKSSTSSMQSAV